MVTQKKRWTRILPNKVVIGLATLGLNGKFFKAPGTIGSVFGLIFYTLLFFHVPIESFILRAALFIYLAIAICEEAEVRLRKHDPSEIVLDEFVSVPLCFLGIEWAYVHYPVWAILLMGFGLFRFFDIVKPLGIKRLQDLKGGLGVVADDVAAALYTCITLHIVCRILS